MSEDIKSELIEKAAIAAYMEMQRPNWLAPLWDEIDEPGRERFLNAARAALSDVLPDVIRQAKAEAWDEGTEAAWERSTPEVNGQTHHWRHEGEPFNPYRTGGHGVRGPHSLVIDTWFGGPTLHLRCTAPADAACRLRPSDEREVWSQDDDDLTGGHECWAVEWVQCVGWGDAVSCAPDVLFPPIPVCVYYDEGVHIEPRSEANE